MKKLIIITAILTILPLLGYFILWIASINPIKEIPIPMVKDGVTSTKFGIIIPGSYTLAFIVDYRNAGNANLNDIFGEFAAYTKEGTPIGKYIPYSIKWEIYNVFNKLVAQG